MTTLHQTVIAAFAAVVLITAIGCRKEVQEVGRVDESAAEPEAAPIPPSGEEGLVTFLSGDVVLKSDDTETFPEIGDPVFSGDVVVTGVDGYVELQFGDMAALRIEENTVFTLNAVSLTSGGDRVSGAMESGTLLAKVRTLSSDDAFDLESHGVVCGVRGTAFMLRSDESGALTVAVSEGAVAVTPPGLAEWSREAVADAEDAADANGNAGDKARDLVARLEEAVPLVTMDQEITVSAQTFEASEQAIQALIEGGDTDEGSVEELVEAVAASLTVVPAVRPISEENAAVIGDAAPVIRPVAVSADAAEPPTVKSLTIAVNPSDAIILLDKKKAGVGRVSRLYPHDTAVEVTVIRAGYETVEKTVVAGEVTLLNVELESTPLETEASTPAEPALIPAAVVATPAAPAAATPVPSESTPSVPAMVVVELVPWPADAAVLVDGKTIGTGRTRYEGEMGTTVAFTARLPGFSPKTLRVPMTAGAPPTELRLEPRPVIQTAPFPGGPAVGDLDIQGGRIVGATARGVVFAAGRNGRIQWSTETANRQNENSSPVVFGNHVFFSGTEEWLRLNISNGSVQARQTLEGDRSDRFGRRLIATEDNLVFPTDTSLVFLDPSSGETESLMSISGGSRMTPVLWRRWILTADQRGTLLYIDPVEKKITTRIPTTAVQPVALGLAIGPDNLGVFSGRRGVVAAVDLANQEVRWERKLRDQSVQVFRDVVVGPRGVYVYAEGTLWGLDISTGEDIFPAITGVSSPPALLDGVLVVGSTEGEVWLVDAVSGGIVGGAPTSEVVRARPVSNGDRIYVAGEKTLYTLHLRGMRGR